MKRSWKKHPGLKTHQAIFDEFWRTLVGFVIIILTIDFLKSWF